MRICAVKVDFSHEQGMAMVKSWIGIAALLASCTWSNLALACSCGPTEFAGFIHTNLERLPANARGALFLPPTGGLRPVARYDGNVMIYSGAARRISASSFSIKSDTDTGNLAVQLTRLDLERDELSAPPQLALRFVRAVDEKAFEKRGGFPDWRPLLKAGKLIDISEELRTASQLLRVGPAAGFKPGSHYTITYLGDSADWAYPATVEHTIDRAPLHAASLAYSLVTDGPPRRRLLMLSTGSGSCTSNQPAIVQDFHYAVPAAASAYQHGILFFSEFQGAPQARGVARRFADLDYQPGLCGGARFGVSALGKGLELMALPCDAAGGRHVVRGWAGLLEVEDKLHRTGAIEIDMGSADGRSCRGFGMLKEALASKDPQHIKAAVCAIGREEQPERQSTPRSLTADELPAEADLLALASVQDLDTRKCTAVALTRLFREAPTQNNQLPETLGRMLKAALASLDPGNIEEVVRLVHDLPPQDPERDKSQGKAKVLYERVLVPALPELVNALVSGKPAWPTGLGVIVGSLGDAAKPYVPVLLDAASGPRPGTEVFSALDQLAADEPAYHALLIRTAANPELRESAALSYHRTAGKSHPERAVALLTEAARHGSQAAIEALGEHGRAARASIPVLLQQMASGADEYLRDAALFALLNVSDAEPEVARAVAARLAKGDSVQLWRVLNDLNAQGRALPAIEMLLQGPLMASERKDLAAAIRGTTLSKTQKNALLARLGRVKTRPQ